MFFLLQELSTLIGGIASSIIKINREMYINVLWREKMKERPFGLSLIAILVVVEAILQILAALALFGLSLAGIFTIVYAGPGLVALMLGIIALIVGIVELAVGMGLWSMEKWAWVVTIIVVWIDLIFDIIGGIAGTMTFSSTLISMIIPVIVLIYLYQGNIRKLFG